MKEDTDEQLLAGIALNDQRAVRAMVSRKLPRLLSLALRMLDDRAEAEDVTQEVFLRVWRQAATWQPGKARFDTWLHRVTLNLCYDRLRRRREWPAAELPERADPAIGAEAALVEQDRQRSVVAAIAALPDRQRAAIVLQYHQGLTNIEAAAALDVSVEALESLLSRARRSLRECLRNDDAS